MRLAIRLIEHKSGQTNFDSESFEYFKIGGDLREVSMMKSVPNWIYYSHKFSRIFFQIVYLFFLGGIWNLGLFIWKSSLTSGTHRSAVLSPDATPRLAGLGGAVHAPV
jgi:hypothetical protein